MFNGSDILKKEAMYIKSLEVFDTICSFNEAERLSKGLNKYFAVGDGMMIIDPDARPETILNEFSAWTETEIKNK